MKNLFYAFYLMLIASLSSQPSLKIYTEDWKPISYMSKDGVPEGYAVDIVKEIEARLGINTEIKILPWARAYNSAMTERNIVLFATTYTLKRNKSLHFLGPIGRSSIFLYSNKDLNKDFDYIKENYKISVYRSSQEEEILKTSKFYNLTATNTPANAGRMMFAGRSDYWANSDFTTQFLLKDIGHSYEEIFTKIKIQDIEIYITFSLGTTMDTMKAWEQALKGMKKDGTLNRIYTEYFPEKTFDSEIKLIPASI